MTFWPLPPITGYTTGRRGRSAEVSAIGGGRLPASIAHRGSTLPASASLPNVSARPRRSTCARRTAEGARLPGGVHAGAPQTDPQRAARYCGEQVQRASANRRNVLWKHRLRRGAQCTGAGRPMPQGRRSSTNRRRTCHPFPTHSGVDGLTASGIDPSQAVMKISTETRRYVNIELPETVPNIENDSEGTTGTSTGLCVADKDFLLM